MFLLQSIIFRKNPKNVPPETEKFLTNKYCCDIVQETNNPEFIP